MQTLWARDSSAWDSVGRLVRHGSATMRDYMLRAVEKSEEDITDDARELYELRRSFSRLDGILDSRS